jgi:hypothetical protein
MAPSGELRLVVVCRYLVDQDLADQDLADQAIRLTPGTLSRARVVNMTANPRVSNPVAANQSA